MSVDPVTRERVLALSDVDLISVADALLTVVSNIDDELGDQLTLCVFEMAERWAPRARWDYQIGWRDQEPTPADRVFELNADRDAFIEHAMFRAAQLTRIPLANDELGVARETP